jgi:hypothetical protein
MKNPSEELVTAWLQECMGYFTMNNVKVPKPGGKGGMGAEIDILATDGRDRLWVEVAVSTNPRQTFRKEERFEGQMGNLLSDFKRADKRAKVKAIFSGRKFRRMVVVGRLALTNPERERFPRAMEDKGVEVVFMKDVLQDLLRLKHYRLDSARGYINLIKAFLLDKHACADSDSDRRGGRGARDE